MNGSRTESFGKYRLQRRLGVGGMAEVFLATAVGPEGFEKQVAIKRILPHLSEDPDFVTMFLDEARLVARFSHPNLVQIFDLGSVAGVFFLAMEYVNGVSLGRVLNACRAKNRRLPPDHSAKMVSMVCEGLEYAHNFTDLRGRPLNLIHRDVNPQNVMLSYDGTVKLLDFGIAKAAINLYRTRHSSIKGKAPYMSPEQIRGKKGLDRRSDVFSTGTMLFELLAGQKPFDGQTDFDLMTSILEDPARKG